MNACKFQFEVYNSCQNNERGKHPLFFSLESTITPAPLALLIVCFSKLAMEVRGAQLHEGCGL